MVGNSMNGSALNGSSKFHKEDDGTLASNEAPKGSSSRRVSRPWRTKFAGQFRVLFWKQFLVSTRNVRATILRTLSPL
jgi:hypothetical protein